MRKQAERRLEHDSATSDRIELDEVTERLLATLVLYTQDKHLDLDVAASRLIELADGNWVALDRAHRHVVTRSGSKPEDAAAGRALDMTRRAMEWAGPC